MADPTMWTINFGDQPVHITTQDGEPLITLFQCAQAAEVTLPADVANALVPVRVAMRILRKSPTVAGVAFLYFLAERIQLAPSVEDPNELATKLLAYRLDAAEGPNGPILHQHLVLGPAGLAIVRADMAAEGITVH